MADSFVNGAPLMQGRISRPRVGNWVAELVADAPSIAGLEDGSAATIQAAGLTFNGTIYRSDVYAQNVTLRVAGGSNGLTRLTKPRFYSNVTAQKPLQDALSDASSSISSASIPAALNTSLRFWTMVEQQVSSAITNLADAAGGGCVWRVQPDGTVFFGADAFLASTLVDFDLIDYLPLEGLQVIAAETADVNPGESFNGRNVSCVEHLIDQRQVRTQLLYET